MWLCLEMFIHKVINYTWYIYLFKFIGFVRTHHINYVDRFIIPPFQCSLQPPLCVRHSRSMFVSHFMQSGRSPLIIAHSIARTSKMLFIRRSVILLTSEQMVYRFFLIDAILQHKHLWFSFSNNSRISWFLYGS